MKTIELNKTHILTSALLLTLMGMNDTAFAVKRVQVLAGAAIQDTKLTAAAGQPAALIGTPQTLLQNAANVNNDKTGVAAGVGADWVAKFGNNGSIGLGAVLLFPFYTVNQNQTDTDRLTLVTQHQDTTTAVGAIPAQVGYSWGDTRVYIDGGPALGWSKTSDSYCFLDAGDLLHCNNDSGNNTRFGGKLGGGIEYNLSPNWAVSASYEHFWFTKTTTTSLAVEPNGVPIPNTTVITAHRPQFGFASVGIIYSWDKVETMSAPSGVYK